MKGHKPERAKENFAFAHSLVLGNRPYEAEVKGLVNMGEYFKGAHNEDIDTSSFGLFDSASPNFSTYFPEVSAEDLTPKDSEFIFPTFRALSEVVVRPFNPVDFSKNGVLKNSMPLLTGQTVYPNHEMLIGNELGSVMDVEWQEARKTKFKGKELIIPAGMNSILKIDGKSHPNIARAINMDPPAIHSVSVTVEFMREPSHPKMEYREFLDKLGTFDEKGVLIRWIVVDIERYHEISLVPHGADQFAQKVDENGNLVNPNNAGARKKLGEDSQEQYFFSFKEDIKKDWAHSTTLSNSESSREPDISNNNSSQNQNQNQMLELIKSILGESAEGLTEEQLTEKGKELLNSVSTLKDEVKTLKGDKATLIEDVKEVKEALTAEEAKVTDLSAKVASNEALLTDARNEAIRLCKLASDNSPAEGIVELISKSDHSAVKSFTAQFRAQVEEKFSATGSIATIGEDGKIVISNASAGEGEETEELSTDDTAKALFKEKTKTNTNHIHGNSK